MRTGLVIRSNVRGVASMRVGCLLIPHFALACERAEQPGLGGGAATVAIVEGRVIREVSPAARRYGVWPGQRLQEALAAWPSLVTQEARPGRYGRRLPILLERP